MTIVRSLISYVDVRKLLRYDWVNILRNAVRGILPLIFFIYVFQIIRLEDVICAFHKMEWPWFFAGSSCILVMNALCSLRTRELLGRQGQSLPTLWAIHALSSLIIGMLPFRAGELSYVYYLRKYCVVPAIKGIAILISVRFVEYSIFLIFIFCLSTVGIILEPDELSLSVFAAIGGNLALVLLLTWNVNSLRRALRFLLRSPLRYLIGETSIDWIFQKVEILGHNLRDAFSHNISVRLLIVTIAIVLLRHAFVLSMLRSMGISITLWLVVLLFAFLYAAKFIQGFGSFGSQEAGITAALILTGKTQAEAFPIAIGTHLLQWVPILLFGVVGYIGVQFFKRSTRPAGVYKDPVQAD